MVFIRALYTVLALFFGAHLRWLVDKPSSLIGLDILGCFVLGVAIGGLFLYDCVSTYPGNW